MPSPAPLHVDVQGLLETFFEETQEHLAAFEVGLLELEAAPNDREVMGRVFRAAHSIKGASGTFGLRDVAHFTHALEGLLDELRGGTRVYDGELAALLLQALDMLRLLVDAGRTGAPVPAAEPALRAKLERMLHGEGVVPVASSDDGEAGVAAAASDVPAERILVVKFAPNADFMASGMDPLLLLRDLATLGEVEAVDLDESALPPLDELDPEACYLAWTMRLRTSRPDADVRDVFVFVDGLCKVELTTIALDAGAGSPEAHAEDQPSVPTQALASPPAQKARADEASAGVAPVPGHAAAATIRVATEKLDQLLDLVGELVIAQAMIVDALRTPADDGAKRLEDALGAMDRNTRELQERVMAIRMVPLSAVFGRVPRIVRDLSASIGKKVHLHIEGEGTEIDKGMVEQLVDPIIHLVRNAIDHGLEPPEERLAAGKPEEGTIGIRAMHQGGNVVIDVYDDGRGLATDVIRAKAVRVGLIEPDAVLTDEQIHELIFQPGFSTAATISDVSGRGVGMDVVKRNVEGLKGSLSISTERGKGSQVRLRLPLTLAILDGLAFRVGTQTFIVPLLSAVESFRPTPAQVRGVFGSADVIDVRGASLPIARLYEILGVPNAVTDPCAGLVCVLESSGSRIAVLVDEIVGQLQVVVKSLEVSYGRVDAVMGATILGDGRVAMILDVPALSRRATQSQSRGFDRASRASAQSSEIAWTS